MMTAKKPKRRYTPFWRLPQSRWRLCPVCGRICTVYDSRTKKGSTTHRLKCPVHGSSPGGVALKRSVEADPPAE